MPTITIHSKIVNGFNCFNIYRQVTADVSYPIFSFDLIMY